MRKLIQVLEKYYIVILFLFLELTGFLLLVKYNTYHQISYLSWTNEITGGLYARVNAITQHMHLVEENEVLTNENALLKKQLQQSYLNSKNDFNPWIDTVYHQSYTYQGAKVINNELSKPNNFMMLDKGSLSGIRTKMGVINAFGVVGIVTDVSKHYSVVMSVLNQDLQLGVRLKGSGFFGSLRWDGDNPQFSILSDIQSFVEVQKGDSVETMGASGIFPEGILVGTVDSISPMAESSTWKIIIKLSANLQSVKHAYVLENIFEEEILELEEE